MESILEKWRSLTQPPSIVAFFRGLFERVGIRVTNTGEQFAGRHSGDRIDFEPTLEPGKVDFIVEIQSSQVDRLAAHVREGEIDEAEQYRIVSTLFTSATAAMLKNPVISHPWLRWIAGVEDLIHVHLQPAPPTEPAVQHTLICANRQWLVLPGLHGKARRVYRLSSADALFYHKRVFATLKSNRWRDWIKFAFWYRGWRKKVSTRDRS